MFYILNTEGVKLYITPFIRVNKEVHFKVHNFENVFGKCQISEIRNKEGKIVNEKMLDLFWGTADTD